jgi:hypothetical protein
MTKRISGGFDMRTKVEFQEEDPRQANQYLVPELRNPISGDPWIWTRPAQMDNFIPNETTSYPLGLVDNVDELASGLRQQGIATVNMSPLCLTITETNAIAFEQQFGPGYFDNAPTEEDLLSRGWRLMGLEPVDLSGLTSGLKGIGYAEPAWSHLRSYFGGALNDVGLFSDEAIAYRFAEVRGLQIRAHAPFVVVGVLVQDRR